MDADFPPRSARDPAAPELYETDAGYVLHCPCCGQFQVVFDTYTLLLDLPTFEALCQTVADAAKRAGNLSSRWWRLATPTNAGEVRMPVRSRELPKLHDLLQGAAAMHELAAILDEADVA